MATIQKRKEKYAVIYDYYDQGKRKQKWESFADKTEALKFKKKIELDKLNQNLVVPNAQSVEAFLLEWANVHGKAKWQFNTYTGNIGMITSHIIPLIGGLEVQEVTPKDIDLMFNALRSKKCAGPKSYNKPEDKVPCLSSTTLRHIYILVKGAFEKAVEWKLIQSNPVVCEAPKKNKGVKTIWDADGFRLALSEIDDPLLHLAIHMAFICSLRIGETVGLTWDCVNFDKKYIRINKTLQRVSRDALAKLPKDNLLFTFPPKMEDKKSTLILKTPKTESSNRFVYITEQLRDELSERKKQIEREKSFLGQNYTDFDLVIALQDGFPVEPKLCEKWFKKWQLRTGLDLPELIFHEIRHSSTTYKLGVSSGDIKTVQGDTGHASAEIVVDTYSHMQDSKRANLMNTIEKDFYGVEHEKSLHGWGSIDELLEAIKKDPLPQQKALDALLAHHGTKT